MAHEGRRSKNSNPPGITRDRAGVAVFFCNGVTENLTEKIRREIQESFYFKTYGAGSGGCGGGGSGDNAKLILEIMRRDDRAD